jgi:hypothetical protein
MRKHALWYLIISVSLILATIIYEWFSFGVTSLSMRLSFIVPLLGGSLSLLAKHYMKPKDYIISLWHMSLSALTIYLILTGIFEIYGSSEPTTFIFLFISMLMTLITVILLIKSKFKGAHS